MIEYSNYVDGILSGESVLYFNNDIFMKRNYINGKLQGTAQKFNKDGVKIEEFKYVDGVISN